MLQPIKKRKDCERKGRASNSLLLSARAVQDNRLAWPCLALIRVYRVLVSAVYVTRILLF